VSPDYRRLQLRLRADINRRLIRPLRMLNAHFEVAGELIGKYGLSRQLRALDAIQLAVALDLHRASPIDHFVCSDQKLCEIAVLEGLNVIDPEQP